MATKKQIEANKLNAQNAGVKTNAGKNVVRHNSFKHGLTSNSLLSDFENINETLEDYEKLIQDLVNSFAPKNQHEESLVSLMATAIWKMRRFDNFEASLWIDGKSDFLSLEPALEYIQVRHVEKMELALRYKQSMEAQYYRAFTALVEGRKANQELDLFCIQGGSSE